MTNHALPKIKVSASQIRSAVTGTLAVLVTVNQILQQIAGTPSLHLPHWLTAAIQLVGVVVPMMSRSLDKSRSGTGGGLFGAAPDKAAEATQGGTVTPQAGFQSGTAPAESDLLATIAGALTPDRMLTLMSLAGSLFSDQHKIAATDAAQQVEAEKIEATRGMSRDALLAGIAARADALAVRPAAGVLQPAAGVLQPAAGVLQPAPEEAAAPVISAASVYEKPKEEATAEAAVPVQEGPALAPPTV